MILNGHGKPERRRPSVKLQRRRGRHDGGGGGRIAARASPCRHAVPARSRRSGRLAPHRSNFILFRSFRVFLDRFQPELHPESQWLDTVKINATDNWIVDDMTDGS
jgi:hypothetical protein